jgi:uncharacterized protein
MGSENLHEDPSVLSDETKNVHRAIVSLMEELEAVDWYGQRAEACTDDELRAVLVHNKNEEIEHAMMTLEWLRRRHPVFADNIATYLGSTGPITSVEAATKEGGEPPAAPGSQGERADVDASASAKSPARGSLGIGSLKGK